MSTRAQVERAPIGWVIAAFAAIYIIWGSTYLAIRIGVQTLPPFLMASSRFLIAGGLLFALVRRSAMERPTWAHWRSAAVVGGLLLLGGNGLVTWAEQTVPSGVAALLVTTVPIWMVLLHWMRRDGARPTLAEGLGVILGFVGVILLIGGNDLGDGTPLDRLGALALVLASLSWAFGSLHARRAALPKSPLLATSMQMLCGGFLLAIFGIAQGEAGQLLTANVSTASVLALLYLVVFGSLVGFTAYSWLLRVTTPAKVGTYAFVNPMVAVLLGCTIGQEPFSSRFVVASGVIILGVIIIVALRPPPRVIDAGTSDAGVLSSGPTALRLNGSDGSAAAPELESATEDDHGRCFSVETLLDQRRQTGRAYYEFLRTGSMSVGVYTLPAGGEDLQCPHGEDEAYYVLSGRAAFRLEDQVRPVEPGDLLYVPARAAHRFEDIREDLNLLVFFAPAEQTGRAAPEWSAAECLS
jgi:drug/metabolite transporter (DMT)-like permease/mannose-6-phosphate isomerase-like protein (cupin superfamily)